jgi:alkane 1-monooxygenase
MTPFQYQLYRFSFWQAPLIVLPMFLGAYYALRNPDLAWLTWLGVFVSYVYVPIMDWLIGTMTTRFTKEEQECLVRDRMLRTVPWVCAAIWLALLAWAIMQAPAVMRLPGLHVVGFVLSLGVVGGVLAINVGHELIHRNNKAERFLGGVLLATVCYGVFKVEHVRGHHLRVATAEDPATARLNETIYMFVPRVIMGTFVHAWRIDAERLSREGVTGVARLLRNESLHWGLLTAAFAMVAFWVSGGAGVAVLLLSGLVAIVELEFVDYIEHYGLVRARDANGKLEAVRYEHSWDYAGWFTNALLINLQRHSDHHAHGGRAFGALNSHPEAPQLPASYSTMILVALIPPLYRRIIHPRLPVSPAASGVSNNSGATASPA